MFHVAAAPFRFLSRLLPPGNTFSTREQLFAKLLSFLSLWGVRTRSYVDLGAQAPKNIEGCEDLGPQAANNNKNLWISRPGLPQQC